MSDNQRLSHEQRLTNILEGTRAGTWEWNVQTGETIYNKRWAEIIGYDLDDISPVSIETWSKFSHPEDLKKSDELLQKHFNGENDYYECEVRMRHKDGHWVWVLDRGKVHSWSEEGKPLWMFGTHVDITEKKGAQEDYLRERFLLKKSQELGQIGVWELDITNNVLRWTDENCRLFGVPVGSSHDYEFFLDKVHPDDLSYVDREWNAAIAGQPYDIVHRIVVNDEIRWVRQKADIYYDDDGVATNAIGFTQDVTERNQEEKLQTVLLQLIDFSTRHTTKELLSEFLNQAEKLTASTIGFYHFVDEDAGQLTLQAWSKNTREKFCKATGEGLHYPIREAGIWVDSIHQRKPVVHNDYASLAHKQGLPEGHAPVLRELVVPVFRGSKIVAILGVGNKPTDYTTTDIYKVQKLADMALEVVLRKEAEDALKESEEKYRLLFDDAAHGSAVADAETGIVLDCNKKFAAMLGYSVEEIIGLHQHDLKQGTYAKDEQTENFKRFKVDEGTIIESTLLKKDGSLLNVEIQGHLLEVNGRQVIHGFFYDISQRKKLIAEQRRTAQLAALGTVAAGVAHEINNPINGVINYATLLKQQAGNHDYVQDISDRISRESERIAHITKTLLFYSQNSRDEKKTVNIKTTIGDALSLIAPKARKSGYLVETDIPESLPPVFANAQSIQQVIVNLVDNAYDALRYKQTEEVKQIDVRACVVESDKVSRLCIEVADNGIGIPADILDKVKDAFYTTKPSAEGSGLGLSIVSEIIADHDGNFAIESVEGEHTKITIHLPLQGSAV